MNPLKKLAGQTAVYGLSSIVGRLLNYFLVPLYTRTFLPHEYGVVTELYAYSSFLIIVLTFGMETAFFRFSESQRKDKPVYSTALIAMLLVNVLFIACGLFFVTPIARALDYSAHKEFVVYFVLILGLDAITSIPFARLRQQNKPLKFAILKLLNIGTNVFFNLFFLLLCPYLLKHNPDSVVNLVYSREVGVGYVFISNLIASIVTLLLLYAEIFKIRFRFDKALFRQMLYYAIPLLVAGLAGMVNETLDRILLKYLLVIPQTVSNSNEYIMSQIGIYGANYKVSILMTLFIQTFRYAAEPFFFSQAKSQNSKQLYADVMKYFVLFCLLLFLGITLYIDIVKGFIGEDYHSGIQIVPILLLANLFLGVVFNLSIWYKLNSLTKFGAYIAIFGAAVTLISNYFLIPILGYLGAAWATFLCYFLMMCLSYFWGQKYYFVPYDLRRILSYFTLALFLYFLSRFMPVHSRVLIFGINTVFFFTFAAIVIRKEKLYKILKFKI